MIQYLEIEDKKYPFLFSMRAVFDFMNGKQLNTLSQMESAVSVNYDSMLELYSNASEKGAKKEGDTELSLNAEQIENFIDDNPELFFELQKLFEESAVMKATIEESEEVDKKK